MRQFVDNTGHTGVPTAAQVGQLALPAGNHLVLAKVVATQLDQSFTVIEDGLLNSETLNLQGTIAGPATVTMDCSAVAGPFNYQKVKMHAIQVESIG